MKKSSFFIQLRNVVVLLSVVGLLVFGVHLVYRFLWQPVFKVEEKAVTTLPVTTDLAEENFQTEEFYNLQEENILDYATQVGGTPWSEDNPPPPQNISVVDPKTGEELIIFWEKPAGPVDFIRLYRGGELIADNLPAEGKFSDMGLTNNKTYYYVLRSVNQIDGEAFASRDATQYFGTPTDSTSPLPPSQVTIKNTGNSGELILLWENPEAEDFAVIRIYRSTLKGEIGSLIKETAQEEYLDKNLIDGQTYYYTLTAVDTAANESTKALISNVIGNPSPF